MGNTATKEKIHAASSTSSELTTDQKPKCKACCACPETKKARDQCIIEKGEDHCGPLIQAHKKCMKDLGFNI